jgi:hypothetical protein
MFIFNEQINFYLFVFLYAQTNLYPVQCHFDPRYAAWFGIIWSCIAWDLHTNSIF